MIRLWDPCPYPAISMVFVGIIGVSAVLSNQVPAFDDVGFPFFDSVLATLVVALLVEIRRRQPNSCPWLDFGKSARIILYIALFVVAVAVVLPGIWPTQDVEWPLRIPAVLLAVAFPALLAIHLKVDHNELEESGVRRSLVIASRLPVYFIFAVIALTLTASLLTLVGVLR